jgi:hypothetical protein
MIKKDNYNKLLDALKNTNIDDNYKPRKYNFGLKDFDKNGEIKKESQIGSQNRFMR